MAMSKVDPLDVRQVDRLDPSQKKQTAGSSKLGKDEFLKLLMAQLGNQDPTSPTDSQAFVSQLAQFTTLELMTNSNTHLEHLLVGQAAQQQTSTVSLVGKDVLYRTDGLHLADGQTATAMASLSAAATNVSAAVVDPSGRTVRTIQLGARDPGQLEITWDGRDDQGNRMPVGDYKLRVTASDKEGKNVSVEQRGYARVTGVSFQNGVPELMLGDVRMQLSEVIEIKERSTP